MDEIIFSSVDGQKIYEIKPQREGARRALKTVYTTKNGKTITLGIFEKIANANGAMEFFRDHNESLSEYFDGTTGYVASNPKLLPSEKESVYEFAAKYKPQFETEEEVKREAYYEQVGNKFRVYYYDKAYNDTKPFGDFATESTASAIANQINSGKDIQQLAKLIIENGSGELFEGDAERINIQRGSRGW